MTSIKTSYMPQESRQFNYSGSLGVNGSPSPGPALDGVSAGDLRSPAYTPSVGSFHVRGLWNPPGSAAAAVPSAHAAAGVWGRQSPPATHTKLATPSSSALAELTAYSEPFLRRSNPSSHLSLSSANSSFASSISRQPRRDSQSSLSSLSSSSTVPTGTGSIAASSSSNTSTTTSVDDEIIPTAIVVKNIPFAIKKEQLIDFMTQLGLPLPYAFNYHFDNGVFRGLAFANFTSGEETAAVITSLNGREIGGRKLRVEYKKMLPVSERERIEREKRERRGQLEEQHGASSPRPSTPSPALGAVGANGNSAVSPLSSAISTADIAAPFRVDMNDQETLELYSSLLLFREDRNPHNARLEMSCVPRLQLMLLTALCAELKLRFETRNDTVVISRLVAPTGSYLRGALASASLGPTINES